MAQEDWVREMTDAELQVLVQEAGERAEYLSPDIRNVINDELRRRKMPLLGVGKSRM